MQLSRARMYSRSMDTQRQELGQSDVGKTKKNFVVLLGEVCKIAARGDTLSEATARDMDLLLTSSGWTNQEFCDECDAREREIKERLEKNADDSVRATTRQLQN